MNSFTAMGVFALLVVMISLWRILNGMDGYSLAALKKTWGNRRALFFHFISHVAVPMVFAIVFLSRGVTENTMRPSNYEILYSGRTLSHLLSVPAEKTSKHTIEKLLHGISLHETGDSPALTFSLPKELPSKTAHSVPLWDMLISP